MGLRLCSLPIAGVHFITDVLKGVHKTQCVCNNNWKRNICDVKRETIFFPRCNSRNKSSITCAQSTKLSPQNRYDITTKVVATKLRLCECLQIGCAGNGLCCLSKQWTFVQDLPLNNIQHNQTSQPIQSNQFLLA